MSVRVEVTRQQRDSLLVLLHRVGTLEGAPLAPIIREFDRAEYQQGFDAERSRSVALPNGPECRWSQSVPGLMTFTTMTTRGN